MKNLKYIMLFPLYLVLAAIEDVKGNTGPSLQQTEKALVYELFRLRNEHKADSAELYYADTVKVYMKYLRNIPRQIITRSDKAFWKAHPKNKFEMTAPVEIIATATGSTAIIKGKEYLDGTSFKYERIEIRFDSNKKIYWYRGYSMKNGG